MFSDFATARAGILAAIKDSILRKRAALAAIMSVSPKPVSMTALSTTNVGEIEPVTSDCPAVSLTGAAAVCGLSSSFPNNEPSW